jgi:Ca2+-binding EF-hand superfamily protein
MKMKTLRKTVKVGCVVLGSLGVIASALLAQDLPERGPVPFAAYDVNGDGYVSKQEFYDIRDARMQQKATAGMPMRNAGNAPDFEVLDTNKDGQLSELELLRGQNANMQNNKGNKGNQNYNNMKDGVLSKQELEESRDKRMEQKAADGKMLKNSANRMDFEDIDANGDGQISKEEFLNHQMRRK